MLNSCTVPERIRNLINNTELLRKSAAEVHEDRQLRAVAQAKTGIGSINDSLDDYADNHDDEIDSNHAGEGEYNSINAPLTPAVNVALALQAPYGEGFLKKIFFCSSGASTIVSTNMQQIYCQRLSGISLSKIC